MKKFMFALTTLIIMTVSAKAMSYEQARQQALFLTDKMAYELNLTQEQYEAAYEVNLDYLMSVNSQSDLYGVYWRQRNLDLEYILLDWQYRMYLEATYFYRPLYWHAGYWHFGIYARYPRRDYFYFGRPHFYHVYRGGHSWRMNGGRSWYHGREFAHRNGNNRVDGMRDGFHRGEFGTGTRGTHTSGNTRSLNSSNGERSFGNGGTQLNRRNIENNGQSANGVRGNSSTRSTVTQPNNNGSRTFGGNSPRNTFAPKSSTTSPQLRKVESPAQSIGTVTPNRTNTNTFGVVVQVVEEAAAEAVLSEAADNNKKNYNSFTTKGSHGSSRLPLFIYIPPLSYRLRILTSQFIILSTSCTGFLKKTLCITLLIIPCPTASTFLSGYSRRTN